MKNIDAFSSFHPLVNFLYFGLTFAFSMTFTHPACLCVSLVCAVTYAIYLGGEKTARFYLFAIPPTFIFTALINPAFSHQGVTILTYLPSGNPLTLESIIYGAAASTMLISAIAWFSCYSAVITSDKFIYLFGRVIPVMSLLLSITLRFASKFKARIKIVSNARKSLGQDISTGGALRRAKNGLTILSIMTTWALENAIETADSMKSRGYGLPGRTAFSIYRFDKRDIAALIYISLLGTYIAVGAAFNALQWQYYPVISGTAFGAFPASVHLACFALYIAPMAVNITEDKKWTYLQSAASPSTTPNDPKTPLTT
ncbi:MAG: energy-coupling factor transporter transmembrane protein EcfT [Clostridiales bacterium]|jgi:energy-coupling factor transport system permease protein|nr:energy-coupling factor transporter transmembrane protein EcfT [Clostridiales bacterium]